MKSNHGDPPHGHTPIAAYFTGPERDWKLVCAHCRKPYVAGHICRKESKP